MNNKSLRKEDLCHHTVVINISDNLDEYYCDLLGRGSSHHYCCGNKDYRDCDYHKKYMDKKRKLDAIAKL